MLESHRIWVYRLNKSLICGLPPVENVVAEDSHLNCSLGTWLTHRAPELALDPDTNRILSERHKAVHDLARSMVKTVQRGDRIQESLYDEFLASSQSFAGLMEATYDTIVASINATDPLTGAETRTLMSARLEDRIFQVRQTGSPAWLLMVDLDHFKSINDFYGHELGDIVLKGFASVVRDHIRSDDLFFRYGGEEFLLCISDVTRKTISHVAERIRKAVAKNFFKAPDGTQFSVTASFGIAALEPDMQVNDAINAADAAMYAAKHAGRNQVFFDPAVAL